MKRLGNKITLSMRTCLRAIDELIRFRMIDQEFLSTSEYLGDRLRVGFESHGARANLRTRSITEAA